MPISDKTITTHLEQPRRPIHRLRDWEDGDPLYGVRAFTSGSTTTGKTFRDTGDRTSDAEHLARDFYRKWCGRGAVAVVLFSATVRNPRVPQTAVSDDEDPPRKVGRYDDVTLLDVSRGER